MESAEFETFEDLRSRIDALEARLERVERRDGTGGVAGGGDVAVKGQLARMHGNDEVVDENSDTLWALNELKRRIPAPGGVLYTGAVTYGVNLQAQWQWAITRDDVLDVDPNSTAQSLAALAHPLRI